MNLEKLKESARRFEQKEEWKKAIDVYLKAIAEVESGRDPHPDLAVYNRLGDLYLKVSDTNAAIRAYERAAEMYAEQGFFNNAIALCGKILRLNPQRSPAYLRLAALHARKNVVIEAKRNLLAYMERMHAAGQLDEAFAAVKQQADAFSANAELRMLVVDLLKAASRESEARDDLQRVADGMEARGDATDVRRSGLVEIAVDFDAPLPPRAAAPVAPAPEPPAPAPSRSGDLVFLDLDAEAAPPAPRLPAPEVAPPAAVEPPAAPPAPAPAPGPLGDLPLIMPDPLDDESAVPLEDLLPSGMTPPPVPVDGRSVLEDPFDGMAVQRLEGIEPTHADAGEVAAAPLDGLEATVAGESTGAVEARVDGLERHDSPEPDEPPIAPVEGLESVEAFDEAAPAAETPADAAGMAPLLDVELLEIEEPEPAEAATTPVDEVAEIVEEGMASVEDEDAAEEPAAIDAAALEAEVAAWEAAIPGEAATEPTVPEEAAEHEPDSEAFESAELEPQPEPVAEAELEGEPEPVAEADAVEVDAAPGDVADASVDDAAFEEGLETSPEPVELQAATAADEFETAPDGTELQAHAATPDVEAVSAAALAPETAPGSATAPDEAPARRIEELEAAVADDPGVPALHHRLADALLDAGETERAIDEFAHALIGYESAGVLDQAWLLADRLVAMRPDVIRFHQKRVEIAFRIEDRVRLIEAYLALGDALIRANAVDKALAVYRRVLDHDPANREAHGALEAYAPRPVTPPAVTPPAVAPAAPPEAPADEAADALPTAVAEDGFIDLGSMILDPEPARDTRMTTAIQPPTGDEQRDFEEALAAFKKGIEENLSDTDYDAHYDLGVAFKEMGLLDEAIAEFQKALRAPEGRLRTSEALGQAFLEKGQVAIAEAVLRRAVESLEGGDDAKVGVLYWLGRAAEAQGRLPDAIAAFERALAVDIRFADVSERLARLGAGRS